MEEKSWIDESKIRRVVENSTSLFKGSRFDVHRLELTTFGEGHCWDFVVHPGAVTILPILEEDRIILIRNKRHAVDEILWELPAGTLEASESPLLTAQRELIEETGYCAGTMRPLLDFYTTPGICNEVMHSFLAEELTYQGQQLDDTENIVVEILPFDEVLKMVHEGIIHDGKTLVVLLYYACMLKNRQSF